MTDTGKKPVREQSERQSFRGCTEAKQFYTCLKTLKIPVAYGVFKKKQTLPFMVYEQDGEDDFCADNKHYAKIHTGYVELYTCYRDFMLEKRLEKAFEKRRISYDMVASGYVAEEEMQCTRWEITIL